jgi:hypothetical protein
MNIHHRKIFRWVVLKRLVYGDYQNRYLLKQMSQILFLEEGLIIKSSL